MSELKTAMTEVIDCTPTWEGVTAVLFAVLEDGTEEGKKIAREELVNMAKVADRYNTFINEYRVEARNIIEKVLPLLKKTKLNFSKNEEMNNTTEWEEAHMVIRQLREDLVIDIFDSNTPIKKGN